MLNATVRGHLQQTRAQSTRLCAHHAGLSRLPPNRLQNKCFFQVSNILPLIEAGQAYNSQKRAAATTICVFFTETTSNAIGEIKESHQVTTLLTLQFKVNSG